MGKYLEIEGTEDVTRKFDTVIFFGLVSNLIYIWFQLYKESIPEYKRPTKMISYGEILVNGIWIAQYTQMIVYRFSHTGKVCAGDYQAS